MKRKEDTERSLELEFDDECTMSDDGGVRHHLALAKVTQGPPRVKVLCNSRHENTNCIPPGQIMSWPYKVRGEPYSNPTENFRPGNVTLALNKF